MASGAGSLGRYTLISEISRGTYGRLWSGAIRHDDGKSEAVLLRRLWKKKPLDAPVLEAVTEVAMQAMAIRDPHVFTCVGVEHTEVEVATVYEYAEGKDLRSLLSLAPLKHQRFPSPVVLHVALSSLDALDALANELPSELANGAVSPDALFLSADGKVRLLDAGVSASIARSPGFAKYEKLAGYAAPEELAGEIGDETDVFRLGVLLWEMSSAKRLFAGVTTFAAMEQVKSLPIPALEGDPLGEVVMRMLQRDPGLRLHTEELRDELNACGVERATEAEVASFLEALTGMGLTAQRRAVTAALSNLTGVPTEEPVPSAEPAKDAVRKFRPPPTPVRPPGLLLGASAGVVRDSEPPTDIQRDSELPTAIQPPTDMQLERLSMADLMEDIDPLDGPTAVQPPDDTFAKLRGQTATGTLLGVPEPAVLSTKKQPHSSRPPPPVSPTLASAPLEAMSLDDLEGPLEPSGITNLDEISMVEVLDDSPKAPEPQPVAPPRALLHAPSPLPVHPLFEEHRTAPAPEDDDLAFVPPPPALKRKHVVAAGAFLGVLLLGVMVFAFMRPSDDEPTAPSASASAATASESVAVPTSEPVALGPPKPKLSASAAPKAQEDASAALAEVDAQALALADLDGGTAKGLVDEATKDGSSADAGVLDKPLTPAEKKQALLAEKEAAKKKKALEAAEKKKAEKLAAQKKAELARQKKKEAALAAYEKKKAAQKLAREKAVAAAKKKAAEKAEKAKKKREAILAAYEKAKEARAKKKRDALLAKQKAAEKKAAAKAAKAARAKAKAKAAANKKLAKKKPAKT